MKTILAAFLVIVGTLAADSYLDSEIVRLNGENKSLREQMAPYEAKLKIKGISPGSVAERKGQDSDAVVVTGFRRRIGINSAAIRSLELQRLGRKQFEGAADTNGGSFYSASSIIVPFTNAPPAMAATNSPDAPKDWRTPQQRAKWEAIKYAPPTKIGPPSPPTKVSTEK